ncbi:MAG: sortase [Caldilineales bacterium]
MPEYRTPDHSAARRAGTPAVWWLVFALALTVALVAGCATAPPQPAPSPTAIDEAPQQLPAPGTELAATPTPAMEDTPAAPAPAVVPTTETAPDAEPPAVGEPNRIVIPAIGLDAPIEDVGWKVIERGDRRYTEWETVDNAAGRHINSARPGETGNVVLSGHHNTKGEVFRAISDLKLTVGDAIYLYDDQGQRFTYIVDEVTDPPLLEVGATEEQRIANARYILPTNDARVTLVTCWPYWTNTHRVIVVGKLASS